jgi:hypothetical protein
MKRRRPLRLERLEPRETPDVSFHAGAVLPAPPPVAGHGAAAVGTDVPAVNAFPGDLTQAAGAFAGDASTFQVDALFSGPLALEGYRTPLAPAEPADEARPANWRGGEPDLNLQGWSFMRNYTQKAIRGDEARRGRLPDHEDVVQQVYLEWRLQVGPGEGALAGLLTGESPEREALRVSVPRVIARARYQHNRQRATQELTDRPAPDRPPAREWLDWQIDSARGAGGLSGRDRRIVELRAGGATFEEIAREVGLPKQRACEAFNAALTRLRRVYATSEG